MAHRLLVIAGENEALRALPGQLGDDIEVRVLDSVNDALWEVRSSPPEAIIADLNLPEMSGLELAEILPGFDVPTRMLLYSNKPDPVAQKQAEECGVYNFLHAPISTEELHAALREAIISAQELVGHASAAPEPEPVPAPEPEPEPAPKPKPAPEPPPRVRPRPAPSPVSTRAGRISTRSMTRTRPITPAIDAPPAASPAPAADVAPTTPADTTATAPFHSSRSRGTLVVTADNLSHIQTIMSRLAQDLGTQCIMLTDMAGIVLVEVGTSHNLPTMILLPLLSTSFSTTGEVARQLGETDPTTLYIHEGVNYDLYCFDLSQRFLLVLVFNKKVATSKIGTVWISTKRAIRELHDALR